MVRKEASRKVCREVFQSEGNKVECKSFLVFAQVFSDKDCNGAEEHCTCNRPGTSCAGDQLCGVSVVIG